ncbi:hypothetical protein H5410_011637 [Solanum commersonii]|uniref:Uncharacterized protein n=1 Tax=Solanum commersonii TaxID=4109 RepID=A0A9J6AQ78_SOLCO|nr:hypothetical protein H5410_011637 [Solanum commersonii]
MGINSTVYNLIIVGKYPTSFLSQGQVNFGEWIIYNDESLTDFLRVPDDYIDQIKLTILEIYVRKEPKTSQQRSPLSIDEHPQLENRNSVDGFPIAQSTDFPNMTHYQNILIGRYDFDLNETINESDCGLPQQDRNIAPSYGLDNYFGQSSHFEMTENVGTSSTFHVSPTFDAYDYQENITQDEPIDPVNIDDRDLPNYGTPSASDSDDLPNLGNREIMFHLRHHLVMMIFNARSITSRDQCPFPIKDCQTAVLKAYGISISRRKAYLDHGVLLKKFMLPRFMEALKHFNPGTIVEWKTERRVDVVEDRMVRSILPLAFAIVANESMETWSLFWIICTCVVKGRRDVALISDRHHGILLIHV